MSEHETPAETIRRAIEQMRADAASVPHGRWEKEFSDVVRTDVPFGGPGYLIAETATVERATYIASWHPAVALAVADLLEAVLQRYEAVLAVHIPSPRPGAVTAADHVQGFDDALRLVARTYLGETP